MADTSAIEWCDATVNFWWGCTKVGPGCDHCYAEAWNAFRGNKLWGHGAPRRRIEGAADSLRHLNRGHDRFFAEHGRRRRVFMQSMSDLFDNEVDQESRDNALTQAELATNLDIIFLTKRVSNVRKLMQARWLDGNWPHHIGLMITVVNQDEANRDIPRVLALKAALGVPWVGLSIEPMLGPIDLTNVRVEGDRVNALTGEVSLHSGRVDRLDWIIVGGETGRNARPANADWIRSLRDQCAETTTPFFFKQWGEYVPTSDANCSYMMKATNKRIAGRELDGRTHDEFWRVAA